jgi:energy-coupling factor transport system permease protein
MTHPVAWLIWLAGGLVALSATRNPLYLAVTLAGVGAVLVSVRRRSTDALSVPVSPLRFAALVITLSALFNAATVHFGRTELFRLPSGLPLFSGPITLEALVFGALNGVVLAGIYTAFLVLNHAVAVRALVGLIPRAFHPVAVVVSIALTFVPTTLRQFQQIREAQAIRGHHVRGLRDWLPLFLPLLIGGLERALQLAEAMTARGFASAEGQTVSVASRLAMAGGLALLLAGWLLQLAWRQPVLGPALMGVGAGAVTAVLWRLGRRVPRTSYRRHTWRVPDTLGALGGVVAASASLVAWPGVNRASIFYYPYPALSMPQFDIVIALALCGLLVPAVLEMRRRTALDAASATVLPAPSPDIADVGAQEAWSSAGGGR